jgi:hypothetical protein
VSNDKDPEGSGPWAILALLLKLATPLIMLKVWISNLIHRDKPKAP